LAVPAENTHCRGVRQRATRGGGVSRQRASRATTATQPGKLPSVLVMTHSHPRLTSGGAEISAEALFRGLREHGAKSWFLGCAPAAAESRLGAILTQPYGPDDYLYSPAAPFDYFKFANPDQRFPEAIEQLVRHLRPEIVHAHHYTHFGAECFSIIKRAHPAARIVLSLHEYLAICHNNGQMVKRQDYRLCESESPVACAQCFPERAPRDFFLRKRFVQAFLDDVDLFLTPSSFLAGRYAAWGIPAHKLRVLENMPPAPAAAAAGSAHRFAADSLLFAAGAEPRATRFGFFGQMSPLKGIDVLMQAAKLLAKAGNTSVRIEIHGSYRNQPMEYQEAVERSLRTAAPNVRYHGPYANADVGRLMRSVDAVIVPSIWWENSPVVIQEALSAGRPVICSNIGGMAEKVRDGLDGLHFEMGQPRHLADILAGLAANPAALDKLNATLARPASASDALQAHLAAYQTVRAGNVMQADAV
jgi:glycosyltransferase involved in cell wall biosynthesis